MIVLGLADPGREVAGVAWLLPFCAVGLPAYQLFQASRASDPELARGASAAYGRGRRLVIVWGLLFGSNEALSFVVTRMVFPPFPDRVMDWFGDAVLADRLAAVDFGLAFVTAGVAIAMVRSLTADQDRRIAAVLDPPAVSYGGNPLPSALPAAPLAPVAPTVPDPEPAPLGPPGSPIRIGPSARARAVAAPGWPVVAVIDRPAPRRDTLRWAWLAGALISVAFVSLGLWLSARADDYGEVRVGSWEDFSPDRAGEGDLTPIVGSEQLAGT